MCIYIHIYIHILYVIPSDWDVSLIEELCWLYVCMCVYIYIEVVVHMKVCVYIYIACHTCMFYVYECMHMSVCVYVLCIYAFAYTFVGAYLYLPYDTHAHVLIAWTPVAGPVKPRERASRVERAALSSASST